MTGAADDEIEARIAQRLTQRLIRALRDRGATLAVAEAAEEPTLRPLLSTAGVQELDCRAVAAASGAVDALRLARGALRAGEAAYGVALTAVGPAVAVAVASASGRVEEARELRVPGDPPAARHLGALTAVAMMRTAIALDSAATLDTLLGVRFGDAVPAAVRAHELLAGGAIAAVRPFVGLRRGDRIGPVEVLRRQETPTELEVVVWQRSLTVPGVGLLLRRPFVGPDGWGRVVDGFVPRDLGDWTHRPLASTGLRHELVAALARRDVLTVADGAWVTRRTCAELLGHDADAVAELRAAANGAHRRGES